MSEVTLEHFLRAAADIGAHGDNDTLPFDVDTNFVSAKQNELAEVAFGFSEELRKDSVSNSKNKIAALTVFSGRLLVAAGASGFRVTTKFNRLLVQTQSPHLRERPAANLNSLPIHYQMDKNRRYEKAQPVKVGLSH